MKYTTILAAILCSFSILFAQVPDHAYFEKRHELYFKFDNPGRDRLEAIGRILSIDNVNASTVFAYANEKEFLKFLELNIPFTALKHPGDAPDVRMSNSIEDVRAWDVYPTYDAYVQMMTQFQTQFPNLCKIHEIGTTVQGRKLLAAKISDNVEMNEAEPNFFFTSSIHGDETTGYVLMLRLIDYILNNYGTDPQITKLVNNLQIYINPLANPDGTYRGGNSSVNGATRSNANSVDMNRNFPDPAAGPHPDGYAWQQEVIAMMNFGKKYTMFHSANFHGGVEVLNYPWDTWSRLHPDDTWFQAVSRAYVDTVHRYSTSSYMTYLNNGITNGYAWYRITGGRQDYFTYFLGGREITMEISNTKLLPAAQLPAHWNYNYRSFLNYLENTLYGIRGTVTNTLGQPIKAKLFIQGHDFDSSHVYSDSITGAYTRMIVPGVYTVIVSSPGHVSKTIPNVQVTSRSTTFLDVQLDPTGTPAGITWQSGINLADNGGLNQTLVFGTAPTATNGIDLSLGEISLPPNPPAGVYDARFELPVTPAEFSVRDYRRDTALSLTWNMKFQPGGGGYPFTLTWSPSALPTGTFYLKDAITGTIINVNMRSQNSVVVTNTGINALVIQYTRTACANIATDMGWSLISVPLNAPDMSTSVLFPQANSAAYAYNNGYTTVTALSPGAGYWIRHPQNGTANVCGNPPTVNTVPLSAGWNLVGAYMNDVQVSGITTTPANIINSAFFGYSNGYANASVLNSGRGYWVRASAAGVMNLPSAFDKHTQPVRALPNESGFGKIIIRDAHNKSSVLYIAAAGSDLSVFELPPVPPQGIFDVRFSTQRQVENLSGASRAMVISGAAYPLTITAENCALNLRDAATNGKIVHASLRSGESLRISNPGVSSIEVSAEETPVSYELKQNYPNPFNPSTTIGFGLPERANVTLSVYNQLGEKIAELFSGVREAGSHSIEWDASNLSSGVYYYEMKAGSFTQMKKLTLLK